jgi:hypothetical protein
MSDDYGWSGEDTAASGVPGSGAAWSLYCEGVAYGAPSPGGEGRILHEPEYGPRREIQYLAEQDLAAHVSTYVECAAVASVIEVQ